MRSKAGTAAMAAALAAVWTARAAGQTAPAGAVTIQEAVAAAIAHNLALATERYGVSVAQAAIVTAGLRPNPVLTLNATRPDTPLVDAGIGTRDGGVRTDYVIEGGGKRQRRIEQATLAESAGELQLVDATRRLVLDVQTAFTDVQLAKLNLALARENLETFDDVVAVNMERVRTGDLARVELERSRLAALQFENDVQQQSAKLEVARSRLNTLMGLAPEAPLEISGDLRRDTEPLDRAALVARALDQRPDLRAARAEQARSAADLRLQLANGRIDYTVSGEYHRQQGGGLTGNSYTVSVGVPLPIFNRNQGEVARARAEQQQADAKTRALEAEATAELDAAFAGYSTARQIVGRIEADMLAPARDVRATMEYSYRRGEASLVELLDAVRAFNDTTRSYNEARAEYAASLYTLDALSGKETR